MKAIRISRYGDASVLEGVELPAPVPSAGEVLIKVTATGVNFADIMSRRGGYATGSSLPFIPGLDCTGTIVATGPGVAGLRAGQRVAAYPKGGSYAECVVASAAMVYPLDPAVPLEAAASLNVLVTAYNLLHLASRIRPEESLLIHAGAGGVGTTVCQMARIHGVRRIFATVGDDAKIPVAAQAGAHVAINYRREDFAARIRSETAGRGVDVILDSVNGEVLAPGLGILAPFGRYIVFGQASGTAASLPTGLLHRENRSVIGYTSGGYRKHRPEALRPAAERAFALTADGRVRMLVGARFSLGEAAKAHELVESRQSIGKVLLMP